MWTAATAQAAIFRIVEDRHRDRLVELLGTDFEGIVTSDRWWAYDLLDPEQRQACWSVTCSATSGSTAKAWPPSSSSEKPASQLTRRLFAAWHAYAEHQDRDRLAVEMTPIQNELRNAARARRQRQQTPPPAPPVREQPAEALARALDIHHRSPASPRRTTPPSERSADRSSTANSPTATNPTTANASPNAPSPPRSPAAYNTAPCSPTSATSSPPTKPAARSPPSSDPNTRRTERLRFWVAVQSCGLSITRCVWAGRRTLGVWSGLRLRRSMTRGVRRAWSS